MMVGDPYGTPDGTFARRGQVAHIRLGSSWGVTFGMFGFDLRFALVAFDLVSDSIWCEGVGVGVGAREGSTWPGGDYLRGPLGWEKWANLRQPTKHVRTSTHKLKPLNHFTVVPHPLSPLRFNRLWAQSRGCDKGKVCKTASRRSWQVRTRQGQGGSRT